MTKTLTIIVIVATTVALIGFDIAAYLTLGNNATISYILATGAMRHPIIAFAFGVLMGHLFASQTQLPQK